MATSALKLKKQPSISNFIKRCSGNMQQIYGRTPMPRNDFNKVAKHINEITLRYGWSSVNLLHIFRTPFPKNTSGGLLLKLKVVILLNTSQSILSKRREWQRYSAYHIDSFSYLNFRVDASSTFNVNFCFPR